MPSAVNAQHLSFLLAWALLGLALSFLFLRARGGWRYFFEYTAFWSLVTLAAYLGLRFGLLRGTNGEVLLQTTYSALLFSPGLDTALYPLAGGWMFSRGRSSAVSRWGFYGVAMWVQGIVHITNSLVWLLRLT